MSILFFRSLLGQEATTGRTWPWATWAVQWWTAGGHTSGPVSHPCHPTVNRTRKRRPLLCFVQIFFEFCDIRVSFLLLFPPFVRVVLLLRNGREDWWTVDGIVMSMSIGWAASSKLVLGPGSSLRSFGWKTTFFLEDAFDWARSIKRRACAISKSGRKERKRPTANEKFKQKSTPSASGFAPIATSIGFSFPAADDTQSTQMMQREHVYNVYKYRKK
jgi:hypothetical protein